MQKDVVIYKQAAIDAVEKHACNTQRILDAISALPSAQPMRWIPCSERFPEDGTSCLVSVRCSKEFVLVDMGTYSTDLSKVDEENFFGERGKSGWYYINSEYGYCRILNVIAWMPLPEPYRAERRTDDCI